MFIKYLSFFSRRRAVSIVYSNIAYNKYLVDNLYSADSLYSEDGLNLADTLYSADSLISADTLYSADNLHSASRFYSAGNQCSVESLYTLLNIYLLLLTLASHNYFFCIHIYYTSIATSDSVY